MELYSLKKQVERVAFDYLLSSCSNNKKTSYLSHEALEREEYIARYARVIFGARLQIFQIKASFPQMYKRNLPCSFCEKFDEAFCHICKRLREKETI